MPDKIVKQFETYQPSLISPNNIIAPAAFNGYCLVRRYRVTVEEIEEPEDVIIGRLVQLLKDVGTNSNSGRVVMAVAKKMGVEL